MKRPALGLIAAGVLALGTPARAGHGDGAWWALGGFVAGAVAGAAIASASDCTVGYAPVCSPPPPPVVVVPPPVILAPPRPPTVIVQAPPRVVRVHRSAMLVRSVPAPVVVGAPPVYYYPAPVVCGTRGPARYHGHPRAGVRVAVGVGW